MRSILHVVAQPITICVKIEQLPHLIMFVIGLFILLVEPVFYIMPTFHYDAVDAPLSKTTGK